MLNPIITPPRVPLVDPRTGMIDRAWYLFFVSLNNVANDVVSDPFVGPSPESLVASYDAVLQTLTQEVETQPSTGELVAQTAEMQKQIDGLQLTPAFEPVQQTTGISGTAALAKLTVLGTDGSLTFVNGLITAYVAPT